MSQKEIKSEVRKYFEMNENEDIACKNMAAGNAVLRGKFIAVYVDLK